MKCYICNKNNANTLEHIIPNGLNGKQKARILCHECNNKTGYMFDCELVKVFSFHLTLFYKNKIPVKLIDGNIESKLINGKIQNKTSAKNGDITIIGDKEYITKQISAMKLNQKYRDDLIIEKIENPIYKTSLEEYDILKYLIAILKIATNFCVKNNISIPKHNAEYILKALNEEDINLSNIINYIEYSPNEISIYNAIIICGDKKQNVIYAIICIYSLSHIVLLDDSYKGEDFTKSYHYDLIENKEQVINDFKNYNIKDELTRDNRLLIPLNVEYCSQFFASRGEVHFGKPNKQTGFNNLLKKRISEIVDEFISPNSSLNNHLKESFIKKYCENV